MLVYDARCQYCHAPVRWCTGANGKKIPLDPRPTVRGNLIIMQLGAGREIAVPYVADKHGHQPHYEPHPATCTKRPEGNAQ